MADDEELERRADQAEARNRATYGWYRQVVRTTRKRWTRKGRSGVWRCYRGRLTTEEKQPSSQQVFVSGCVDENWGRSDSYACYVCEGSGLLAPPEEKQP